MCSNFRWSNARILIGALLLVSATALAQSAEEKPNLNPCNITQEEAEGLSHDPSVDINAIQAYIDTVSVMLHQQRFDQLDCIADRARANKEWFPGGMRKIHNLYAGLYQPEPGMHATENDWQDLLHSLQHWVETHPKSVTARVALASAWLAYAGEARGGGLSETVSESGWKLYAERTAQAEQILEDASTLPVQCPEWYVAMLGVGQNQSWGATRLRALFDKAMAFDPGYYYYGQIMAWLLEPKWFGKPGDTAKFVEEVADRIGGEKGDAFYFQVASSNEVICLCPETPHLSGERIARGYEAVEKQYGVSMLSLNRLAFLMLWDGKADPIAADKAFTRIGMEWDKETWENQKGFEDSKKYAAQMVPIVLKGRANEEKAKTNLETPEGTRYQAAFEKTYKEMLRECVHSDGGGVSEWEGEFKTVIRVGANGSFEEGGIDCGGPVVVCMYRKMVASRSEKSSLFPVPPRESYWVRIDLDWADFAPVAAAK